MGPRSEYVLTRMESVQTRNLDPVSIVTYVTFQQHHIGAVTLFEGGNIYLFNDIHT